MTNAVQTPHNNEQITLWLRGLLTVAWADGNFDEQEKEIINNITKDELAPCLDWQTFETISRYIKPTQIYLSTDRQDLELRLLPASP